MTRALPSALCLLALAGCGSSGGEPAAKTPAPKLDLAGAPAPVKQLYSRPNRLLGGGLTAYHAQLKRLRGTPVVVNKWASWCPPCRAEFPYFRDQAAKRAKKTAFFGVDSNDNDGDARKFLASLPVGYPSFTDGNNKIAADFNGVQAFPTTVFYDRKGGVSFLHQGAYESERKLAEDIDRYAR
ncbi:MAG TPA: redoxin family protein [Thermoleophilaceae bacterium]|jgi:thiol-disulfide isomerase/thioredoxin